MRLAHTQVWPVLRNFEATTSRTAASRSASSKTRNGAWPPSSSDTRFTVLRRLRRQQDADLGAAGEGELANRRIVEEHADTAAGSAVVSTWNTSAGPPASRHSSSRRSAVSGDCSAGFSTTVQPAASAGAALRVTIAAGKFHGVTA